MRLLTSLVLFVATAVPTFAADLVVHKSMHTDATKIMGQDVPAEDTTSVTWFGKDRMRIESGDEITIVRTDLKKMWRIDTKAKTYQTVDLPFDMKKYVPAEQYAMVEPFLAQITVTVTPTTETKKIRDWNCTKYTMSMSMPMGMTVAHEIWATKDIPVDRAVATDMMASVRSATMGGMGGANFATEWQKIEGFVVLDQQERRIGTTPQKSKEEVTSVESKDAPEGHYELPKDYKELPFDPMAGNPMAGGKGPKRGERTPPAPEKPKERPPVPQPK